MAHKKHRKRKKVLRPFCWYCERKFVDERILVMHQKARHFKCPHCLKKLGSASGLVVHIYQMHKEKITKVPNSKPNRDSIHYDIYGMDGVPFEDILEYRARHTTPNRSKLAGSLSGSTNASHKAFGYAKKSITDAVAPLTTPDLNANPQPIAPSGPVPAWLLPMQPPLMPMPDGNYWVPPHQSLHPSLSLGTTDVHGLPTSVTVASSLSQQLPTATNTAVPSGAPSLSVKNIVIIFDGNEYSQEEYRAKLERYAYNAEKNMLRMEKIDKLFESRLASLTSATH